MSKKIIRLIITVVGGIIGYCSGILIFMLAASTYSGNQNYAYPRAETAVPIITGVLFLLLAFAVAPKLIRKWSRMGSKLEKNIQRMPLIEAIGAILGLILGLVISYLLSGLFAKIEILHLGLALIILTYLILGSLGCFIGSRAGKSFEIYRSTDEEKHVATSTARGVNRGKSSKHEFTAVPKILDTSVLVDGRIFDIMKTGFIEGKIIIPEYVLTELRHLSDSADPMKKIRGRRGLEVLKDIQTYFGVEIYNTYTDKDWAGADEVDVKLLRLAQKLKGRVVTNDYNLIQVAGIQEIPVLNINDVVKALRPVVIPGEVIHLQVVKEGREANQGVGYMDDGTMIVIEGGRSLIGEDIAAEVTTVLQTASGRMIFAKPKRNRS